MTGRKVTRRASMRRKSMRSPSASSTGSRTARSVVSEPRTSGKASFNTSIEKLEIDNMTGSQACASFPANNVINNSSERLSERSLGQAAKQELSPSPSEMLAQEFAAVKINDSRENLVDKEEKDDDEDENKQVKEEVVPTTTSTSLTDSNTSSLNAAEPVDVSEISLNRSSKGSIAELAKSRSTSSLNKVTTAKNTSLQRTNSKLDLETAVQEAKKSVGELVAVSLDSSELAESEKNESVEVQKQTEEEKTTEAQSNTAEETKKSCLDQKISKMCCVIS